MFDQVEEIFDRARELKADERKAFLEKACHGDDDLREEIEALVAADSKTEPLLDQKATLSLVQLPEFPKVGERIGRYDLVQKIGEGGMGVVFLAKQEIPVSRNVAVKIIHARQSASAEVIRRFESERQVLAMFDHPSVTTVFDGGLTDCGLPYFVMEYFGGEPITHFCQRNGLSLRARLKLFVEVCGAIEHAHQKGIIHRDIKPTNILVASSEGRTQVRVIDFGIAKALGTLESPAAKPHTQLGTFVGTPEYMSPEQARMDQTPIDVRSDVFSLGVLLFEMVTGTVPLDGRLPKDQSLLKTLELVRDSDAETVSSRVSKLPMSETHPAKTMEISVEKYSKTLRGEVDWIVLKALANEPEARYDSVAAFREDLENYLNHDPVSVAAPSKMYRFRKLFLKHRVASVAILLALTALVAATVVSTIQSVKAHRAKEKSELLARQLQRKSDRLTNALVRATEGDQLKQNILYRKKTEAASTRAMSRYTQFEFSRMVRWAYEEQDLEFEPGDESVNDYGAFSGPIPPFPATFFGPDMGNGDMAELSMMPPPGGMGAVFQLRLNGSGIPSSDEGEWPTGEEASNHQEMHADPFFDAELASHGAIDQQEAFLGNGLVLFPALIPKSEGENQELPLIPSHLLSDLRAYVKAESASEDFGLRLDVYFQFLAEEFEKEFGPYEEVVKHAKIMQAQMLLELGRPAEGHKVCETLLEEFCAPRATDVRQFLCRMIRYQCERKLGVPSVVDFEDLQIEFRGLVLPLETKRMIQEAFPDLKV